ncbi:MAG TPA: PAP2 family protein [Verrucomicrobiales bacterium]|nr:PAP2 family protein [Verrucomicrobiales bacterium]
MAGGFACLALLCPPAARGAGATELSGDVLQFALPAAALGLTAWYEDRTGAIEFAESAAATLAVTYTLKYTVSERRPNGGAHSFPSGHTSISFASAEFMRKRYGWEYGVPAYAAATWVAYSRVASRQHHTYDVVAGGAIGILSSYLLTREYQGWHADADLGTHYWGIQLSRAW